MKDVATIEYSWNHGEMAIMDMKSGDTRTLEKNEEEDVVNTYPIIDLDKDKGKVYVEPGELEAKLLKQS
jgi:hypothetical protein